MLHPLSVNRFDTGLVRLASIANACYYRIAVLWDGAKQVTHTARFRKAERGFLDDVLLPWGQQVAVMFQIMCALILDVPATAECVMDFHGVSPDVFLAFKQWDHVDHTGVVCGCHSSVWTGAYVHVLGLDSLPSLCTPTGLLSQQAPSISGDVLPCESTIGIPARLRMLGSIRYVPAQFRSYLTELVHMAG